MNLLSMMGPTFVASFLASLVEFVEAFTIVLAVGITQNWRSALVGTSLAILTLGAMVLVLGPLLLLVPIGLLQLVIGTLLILFGTRWLRKAILRSIGGIPLHDEMRVFAAGTTELRQHARDRRGDTLAMLTAYKAVLLEGLEVVFIVVAVGTAQGLTIAAAVGALAAFALVLAVGLIVHKPLSRVPENLLKYVVGLMLTTFGIFWTGEGLGVEWPGDDLALLGILALTTAVSVFTGRALSASVSAKGAAQ